MKFKSIAMRIMVSVIPMISVATLIFIVLSYYMSNTQINNTINDKISEGLHSAEFQIQLELQKNASIAENFASFSHLLDPKDFDLDEYRLYAEENLGTNSNTMGGGVWYKPYGFVSDSYYFGPFMYKDSNGGTVFVPEYGLEVDYFNEDWYIKGLNSNGETVWSVIYYDPVSTITMVTAVKAFYDETGEFLGVGTADMDLADINKIVGSISVGNSGKAFIIGPKGRYISFPGNERSIDQFIQNDPDPALAALGAELLSNDSGVSTLERDGKKQRVYYMTMKSVNWTLAILYDETEVSSSALRNFLFMSVIPFVGLLLVIVSILLVTRYLRRIVNKVNSFADSAASGDLTKLITVSESDEFGFMEQRLNVMILNMNEMRQRSAELLKMAENASSAKSEFLSRMSHEIRTPMNAIIGMTQIARGSKDPERINDCLNKINAASKRLLALLNDILDMSKIEANKLELTNEEFNLESTMRDVCDIYRVQSDDKHQTFSLDICGTAPRYVVGDELRFSQIVTNLIGNAIKFTPESGEVSVAVDAELNDEEYSVVRVTVRDSGIGIAPDQLERLFTSFEQADGGIARSYGGTGLGLSISKRLVEIMGGHILVNSELGKGSSFSFSVRLKRGAGTRQELMRHDKPIDLKLLVVDDSEEARDYLRYVLNTLTFDCDIARDGYEALTATELAIAEGHPYDIIFMDYLMPRLNGIEAAQKIKEISNGSTSVVMVSIADWHELESRAKTAGIFKHISKPFSPSNIFDVIQEAKSDVILSGYNNVKLPVSDFCGNTILLVEDLEINREIVIALLEDNNVIIEVAENGQKACELFAENPDKYDLILMDIQMPVMDGYEATRRIRRMDVKRARTIPIIAMTANALKEDVMMCRRAGMNDHIAKPIEAEVMLFKLRDYLFMTDFLDGDIG